MEELNKLLEKKVYRITAIIIVWHLLTQEERESFDFKTLSQVWEAFPETPEKEEVWDLLKNTAKSFGQYIYLLENVMIEKLDYFDKLKKEAKTFSQKLWVWQNFWKYYDEENNIQLTGTWNWLKKKATTLKRLVKLWEATGKDSKEEAEIFIMIKEKTKDFSDCQFLLDGCFSPRTKEWEEIYTIAEEKPTSFEDYLFLWKMDKNKEIEVLLWLDIEMKAETLEQKIHLFEVANYINDPESLDLVRKML